MAAAAGVGSSDHSTSAMMTGVMLIKALVPEVCLYVKMDSLAAAAVARSMSEPAP